MRTPAAAAKLQDPPRRIQKHLHNKYTYIIPTHTDIDLHTCGSSETLGSSSSYANASSQYTCFFYSSYIITMYTDMDAHTCRSSQTLMLWFVIFKCVITIHIYISSQYTRIHIYAPGEAATSRDPPRRIQTHHHSNHMFVPLPPAYFPRVSLPSRFLSCRQHPQPVLQWRRRGGVTQHTNSKHAQTDTDAQTRRCRHTCRHTHTHTQLQYRLNGVQVCWGVLCVCVIHASTTNTCLHHIHMHSRCTMSHFETCQNLGNILRMAPIPEHIRPNMSNKRAYLSIFCIWKKLEHNSRFRQRWKFSAFHQAWMEGWWKWHIIRKRVWLRADQSTAKYVNWSIHMHLIYIYIYMYIYIYIHIYACINTYIYMYICIDICTHTFIYMYTISMWHIWLRTYQSISKYVT